MSHIHNQRKILFYSPDFSLCYSLQAFLQDKYSVTTSTDFSLLEAMLEKGNFDLLIIDSEPTDKVEEVCKFINVKGLNTKVILTYVYSKGIHDVEDRLKNCVAAIFYKPFDLNEISLSIQKISANSIHHHD